jgi:hypothetical protein
MESWSKQFFRRIQNGGQELQRPIARHSREAALVHPTDQIILAIDSITFNLTSRLGSC